MVAQGYDQLDKTLNRVLIALLCGVAALTDLEPQAGELRGAEVQHPTDPPGVTILLGAAVRQVNRVGQADLAPS